MDEVKTKEIVPVWNCMAKYFLRFVVLFLIVLMGVKWFIAKPALALSEESVKPQVNEKQTASDPVYLRSVVDKLAVEFAPRAYNNLDNLNKTADFIKAEFQKVSQNVYEQEYSTGGNDYRNIMAEFGPKEGKAVVIGAHYDTCQAHRCSEGHLHETPGADDNASGIAGLLSLAKLLKHVEIDFPLVLVAYTLEEPPHFRSETMGVLSMLKC